jgi:hypothetical protein
MPSSMSHFERGQDLFSSAHYPPYAGTSNPTFVLSCPTSHHISDPLDVPPLPMRTFSDMPDHRTQGLSSVSSTSSPSLGQSASFGPSSKATSRSPPPRQRTPIRHHRSSVSRGQSSSRPEALLAYAAQQEPEAATSQSMSSSQSGFPPSAYLMAPASSAYRDQSAYYASATMPQQQPGNQYMLGPSSYSQDPTSSTYCSLGRSASYPMDALPAMHPSDSLYQPPLGANGGSMNWQSSNAAQTLPSMSLATSSGYSPSPASDSSDGIRVLASRPKPQCFDHGCNGRQFSTFSNLLRHQREKSGNASKAVCPHCGTEFTRTTARNGHLYGGKCKGRDGQGGTQEEDE